MKIAFLDRDGVLNREIGRHVCDPSEFEILPDVVEALQKLVSLGYKLVVITNQSGIGLELYDHNLVNEVHEQLSTMLTAHGMSLLEIYYCPHHPSKTKCLCRKPEGLLLEKALGKYKVDPAYCIMFGDRERDVQAANSVGVRGVLLESNSGLLNAMKTLEL